MKVVVGKNLKCKYMRMNISMALIYITSNWMIIYTLAIIAYYFGWENIKTFMENRSIIILYKYNWPSMDLG